MQLDLTGTRAKLAWARHHFDSVDAEIAAWLNTDPYYFTYHRNDEFTEFWMTFHIRGDRPDFERWSLMVGDCVTNLRDSLDHLIYGIAQLPTSPRPEKSHAAAFIIRDEPTGFTKDARCRLCSVPTAVYDTVLSFQPFNRPIPELPPLLGILRELANGNKHKLLALMMTTVAQYDVQFVGEGSLAQNGIFSVCKGHLDDGKVAFSFKLQIPDPNIQLDRQSKVGLHISLPHKPRHGDTAFDADRTAYHALLNAVFAEVELVIDTITNLV